MLFSWCRLGWAGLGWSTGGHTGGLARGARAAVGGKRQPGPQADVERRGADPRSSADSAYLLRHVILKQ